MTEETGVGEERQSEAVRNSFPRKTLTFSTKKMKELESLLSLGAERTQPNNSVCVCVCIN